MTSHLTLHFMFLLALLGCQAFASDSNWKSEAAVESNDANFMFQAWRYVVVNWIVPKDTGFEENAIIDHLENRLNVKAKSYQIQKTEEKGGTWIRGTVNGLHLSAFMHPTKRHTAGIFTVFAQKVLPEKRLVAKPGDWAVAFGNTTVSLGVAPVYQIIE